MNRDRHILFAGAVFTFALFVRLVHWLRAGLGHPRMPPDAETYYRICGDIGGELAALLPDLAVYVGFIGPMCSVVNLTGGSIQAWLLVQVVLSAATCLLVYLTGARLYDQGVGVIAGGTLAVFYDTYRWQIALLSDTLFVFVVALSIWSTTRFYLDQTRRNRLLVYGSLGWLVITRPHGAPILAGWIFADLFSREEWRIGILKRRFAIATTVVGGLFTIWLLLQMDVTHWMKGGDIFWGGKNRTPLTYNYESRPARNMLEFIIFNIDHVIALGALKIVAFLFPIVNWGYSGPQWRLVHQITLAPVVAGALIGIGKMIRDRATAIRVWLFPFVGLLLFISITFIDYFTFRYRAPAGPFFALYTGYVIGTSCLFLKVKAIMSEQIRQLEPMERFLSE